MKRIGIILLSIANLTVFSCSSQYGPTEDEAYAGAWIGQSELGIEEVIEMTDTTFASYVHYSNLNGFVPAYKGFVSNDPDTSSFYLVTTEIYQLDDYSIDSGTGLITTASTEGEFVSADEADSTFSVWNYRETFAYSISGEFITFDGEFTMTRTQPVSEDLLE